MNTGTAILRAVATSVESKEEERKRVKGRELLLENGLCFPVVKDGVCNPALLDKNKEICYRVVQDLREIYKMTALNNGAEALGDFFARNQRNRSEKTRITSFEVYWGGARVFVERPEGIELVKYLVRGGYVDRLGVEQLDSGRDVA